MKKITGFFKKHLLFILFCLGLLLALVPYYRDGKMIAGGEGSYFFDFFTLFRNYGYSWANYGAGIFQPSLSFAFVPHLILFQHVFQSERVVNFLMIYSIYLLPFLAFYLLAIEFKIKPFLAVMISIFYIANPFTINFLKFINQWNMLAAYILPSFFFIIYKFFDHNLKLFFVFGLNSLLFAFCNANPPLMAIYQISLPLFVLLGLVSKRNSFRFFVFVKKYFLVLSSFIFFNLWWLLNWVYIFNDAQLGYSKQFAISWLRGSGKFVPAFWKLLNLTVNLGHPIDPAHDFFSRYYSHSLSLGVLLIPVIIVLIFLLKDGLGKKQHQALLIIFLGVAFMSKGVNSIFGTIYEWMVLEFPLFSIFKSAEEKWGILYAFLFSLFLIFIFKEFKTNNFWKIILGLFLVYIGFSLVPFAIGEFIPDYKFDYIEQLVGTRRFYNKNEYLDLRESLNSDPEQYRVLSLPGGANYQLALKIEGKKYYTGNDPVLSNINHSFIAPYTGTFDKKFGFLFNSISEPNYLSLLGLFNIKKIVINKDSYPWFGFQEKETIPEMEAIFDQKLSSSKNEVISLFDVNDYFLPKFYTPDQLIYSPTAGQDNLFFLNSLNDLSPRRAFYVNPEEENKFVNKDSVYLKENSAMEIVVSDIQSAVDETRLRMGIRGLNPGGVLFPYARWKPGGLLYPLVEKKELKMREKIIDQPEALLEYNLFFAAKRIYEIQRWEKNLKEDQLLNNLARYQNEMEEAIENLRIINKTGKDTFWLLARLEVSFEAHRKRLMDVLEGNHIDDGQNHPRIVSGKLILENIENELKELVKSDYAVTKYYFRVEEEGKYEILVEKSKASSEWKVKRLKTPSSENEVMAVSNWQGEEHWLSFGEAKFGQGKHYLTTLKPPSKNLVRENWVKLNENLHIEPQNRVFFKDLFPFSYQDILDWSPEKTFKLSVDYRTEKGRLRMFLAEGDSDKINTYWSELIKIKDDEKILPPKPKEINILLDEKLKSEGNWDQFETTLNSGKDYNLGRLFIGQEPGPDQEAKIELKNLKLEMVIEPNLILKKVSENKILPSPGISFQKINATKYLVDVKNAIDPYYLIFSESYHRGWRVYFKPSETQNILKESYIADYFEGQIKEKKAESSVWEKRFFETWFRKPISSDKHFVANSYANSWLIIPEDVDNLADYQLIIEYWPQRLFYLGGIVTLLILFGTALLLFF